MNDLSEDEFQYKNILKIINCNYRERKKADKIILSNFIKKLGVRQFFREELSELNYDLDNFCYFASQSITTQKYSKDEHIYNPGDPCQFLYYIYSGELEFYDLRQKKENFFGENYYLYLYELYNNKEDELVIKKIIEENKSLFPIQDISDLSHLKDILFSIKVSFFAKNNDINKIKILLQNNPNISLNGFDKVVEKEMTCEEFNFNFQKTFTQTEHFYYKILEEEFNFVYIHFNDKNKLALKKEFYKPLVLYEKKLFDTKQKQYDFFGDFDTSGFRDEFVKCKSDEVILIQINKKHMIDFFQQKNKDNQQKDFEFIHGAYFFRVLGKGAFTRKVFNQLEPMKLIKNQTIMNKGKENRYFYIITSGTVEFSLKNYNLIELHKITEKLKSLLLPKNRDLNVEKNFYLEHNMSPLLNSSIEIKRDFMIFISEKALYGELEFFYDIPNYFTLKVISEKAKVYAFPYEKYNLIEDKKELNQSLSIDSQNKIKSILERLLTLGNSIFQKINEQYIKITKEQENYYAELVRKNKSSLNIHPAKNENLTQNNYQNSNKNKRIIYSTLEENTKKIPKPNIFVSELPKRKKELRTISNRNSPNNSILRNDNSYLPLIGKSYNHISSTECCGEESEILERGKVKSTNSIDRLKYITNRKKKVYPLQISQNAPLINRLKRPRVLNPLPGNIHLEVIFISENKLKENSKNFGKTPKKKSSNQLTTYSCKTNEKSCQV